MDEKIENMEKKESVPDKSISEATAADTVTVTNGTEAAAVEIEENTVVEDPKEEQEPQKEEDEESSAPMPGDSDFGEWLTVDEATDAVDPETEKKLLDDGVEAKQADVEMLDLTGEEVAAKSESEKMDTSVKEEENGESSKKDGADENDPDKIVFKPPIEMRYGSLEERYNKLVAAMEEMQKTPKDVVIKLMIKYKTSDPVFLVRSSDKEILQWKRNMAACPVCQLVFKKRQNHIFGTHLPPSLNFANRNKLEVAHNLAHWLHLLKWYLGLKTMTELYQKAVTQRCVPGMYMNMNNRFGTLTILARCQGFEWFENRLGYLGDLTHELTLCRLLLLLPDDKTRQEMASLPDHDAKRLSAASARGSPGKAEPGGAKPGYTKSGSSKSYGATVRPSYAGAKKRPTGAPGPRFSNPALKTAAKIKSNYNKARGTTWQPMRSQFSDGSRHERPYSGSASVRSLKPFSLLSPMPSEMGRMQQYAKHPDEDLRSAPYSSAGRMSRFSGNSQASQLSYTDDNPLASFMRMTPTSDFRQDMRSPVTNPPALSQGMGMTQGALDNLYNRSSLQMGLSSGGAGYGGQPMFDYGSQQEVGIHSTISAQQRFRAADMQADRRGQDQFRSPQMRQSRYAEDAFGKFAEDDFRGAASGDKFWSPSQQWNMSQNSQQGQKRKQPQQKKNPQAGKRQRYEDGQGQGRSGYPPALTSVYDVPGLQAGSTRGGGGGRGGRGGAGPPRGRGGGGPPRGRGGSAARGKRGGLVRGGGQIPGAGANKKQKKRPGKKPEEDSKPMSFW